VAHRHRPGISRQPSAVSHRPSAVSHQPSAWPRRALRASCGTSPAGRRRIGATANRCNGSTAVGGCGAFRPPEAVQGHPHRRTRGLGASDAVGPGSDERPRPSRGSGPGRYDGDGDRARPRRRRARPPAAGGLARLPMSAKRSGDVHPAHGPLAPRPRCVREKSSASAAPAWARRCAWPRSRSDAVRPRSARTLVGSRSAPGPTSPSLHRTDIRAVRVPPLALGATLRRRGG
jgi:hypothetical protein